MAYQIIQQPNGKYAVFSINSSRIVLHNANAEEIIYAFSAGDIQATRANVLGVIAALERGRKPYDKFTKTWAQAIDTMKYHHGAVVVNRLLEETEQDEASEPESDGDEMPNVFSLLLSGAYTVEEAQGILGDYINRLLEARTERVAQLVEEEGIYEVPNLDTLSAQIRSMDSPVAVAVALAKAGDVV